jgi:hypothetical protein
VSFLSFRTSLTIPAKIGSFETAGAKAVLTAYVDDYAEVWVNGEMPRRAGITSPATIQGFNIPNRVVLSDAVKAGDKIEVAIFGINGPISVAPPELRVLPPGIGRVLQVGSPRTKSRASLRSRRLVSRSATATCVRAYVALPLP